MAQAKGEIAATEGKNEMFCEECEYVSSVLSKVVVRRDSTIFINKVEVSEELWCPDCLRSAQYV